MTLRLHIAPTADTIPDDNGIGRIVHAQYRDLPAHGITLTDAASAEVVAAHIERGALPRVDVLHCHGVYYADIPHAPYASWHHTANLRIAAAAREARAITVPSPWVAEVFKRDMRITPHIIPHGIDLDAWEPVAQPAGYVLWNKNRADDVCSTAPAVALARAGIPVVATFGEAGIPLLKVIGAQPHTAMRDIVRHAGVYLATTPETFGIGTLEAMAAGVPVLGYDWCGTADLVRNGIDGILVAPGDTAALVAAYGKLTPEMGRNARARAGEYGWDAVMAQYAALYQSVATERQQRDRVAVVITNYNYGRYVGGAIDSVLDTADEVIVVDDGSTDGSPALIAAYDDVRLIEQRNQGVAAARNAGIAATDCELIVCLDADDELASEYIPTCANALRADRGLGIAYTGLGFLNDNGSVTSSLFPPAFDWAKQAEPTNPPATTIPTAAMFRRSLWERAGGYVQYYAPGEDAEFYTRGLSVGFGARKVVDDALIHYRAHPGSASRTKAYKAVDTWHPWMRDGQFPFAAPTRTPVPVRSYAAPVVSVIIPVGSGHARYLTAALDSLLGQDFRQWEAIVVDDEDTQEHPHIWQRMYQTYPFANFLCYQRDSRSRGPSAARNIGVITARAPLVLFLDADDWLLPGALSAMARLFVAHGGAHYVYGDAIAHGDGDPRRLTAPDYDQAGWWREGRDGTPRMHHSVTALVPTEHARAVGFDEGLRGWEEQFFFADLAARGVCGVRLPEPVIGYRVGSGTVRAQSFANSDTLRGVRRDRYARYLSGEETPMACCGGNAAVYDAAARALEEAQWTGDAVPPGMTLMRYTGKSAGTFSLSMERGVPLRGRYQWSTAPENNIRPVWDEDVQRLLNVGQFAVVETPPPAPPAPIVADALPTVATETAADPDADTKPMRRRRAS